VKRLSFSHIAKQRKKMNNSTSAFKVKGSRGGKRILSHGGGGRLVEINKLV